MNYVELRVVGTVLTVTEVENVTVVVVYEVQII